MRTHALTTLAVTVLSLVLLPTARAQDQGALLGSDVHAADVKSGHNVVFLSDGYPASQQAIFLADAKGMAATVDTDAAGKQMTQARPLNFHYVFVPSEDTGVPTALGAAPARSPFKTTVSSAGVMQCDTGAADLAAARYAPAVDTVIIVAAFAGGAVSGDESFRANSDIRQYGSRVRIPRWCANAFVHELGHAIFGLGDEYGDMDQNGAIPEEQKDFVAIFPNLSFDSTGARWAGIVQGAVLGGYTYNQGVWHPTKTCRMGNQCFDSSGLLCPVCAAQLASLATARPDAPRIDGPRGTVSGEVFAQVASGAGSLPTSYDCVVESRDGTIVARARAEASGRVSLGTIPAGHYTLVVTATNLLGNSPPSSAGIDVSGSSSGGRPAGIAPLPQSVGLVGALGGLGAR